MIKAGDIVSYTEMCNELAVNLQPGMNFRLRRGESVILMSLRPNAPYADRVEQGGKIIVYEGHDIARIKGAPNPKTLDQPEVHTGGRPTQNGLFIDAVRRFKAGKANAEKVHVYEKIRPGIWVYKGYSDLLMDGQKRLKTGKCSSSNWSCPAARLRRPRTKGSRITTV
jgi:hypothetical protein